MGKCYTIGETSDAFEKPYGIFDLETGNVAYSEDGTALVFNTMHEAEAYAFYTSIYSIYELKRFVATMPNNQRKRFGLPMIRMQGLKRAWKNRRKE